jgi:hypothetical protein
MARRLAAAFLAALLLPACAAAPVVARREPAGARPPGFELGRDTFAFANLVRAEHPDQAVAFANYCIIMVRGASQFFRFARFDRTAPPVTDAEYTRLAREVMTVGAWEAPWPLERRIVIPGYPDLYALSRAREAAIKAAVMADSYVLSIVHWRTWRILVPLPKAHQVRVARELEAEVDAGRPVPIMITNWPTPDTVNHSVLVYDYRPGARGVEFLAYDPNDPPSPLSLHFDPAAPGFWVEPLPYGPPGRLRAFRLFTSPLL